MTTLTPLETLYAVERGETLPLPVELEALYGSLRFPLHTDRAYVIGNFVTTLDGVVSLNVPGQSGGGEISGFNQHDRMVMGLLRAVVDAVIVGAGTVRAVSPHLWTAEYAYPPLADAYRRLHAELGKPEPPLHVIVTARGEIDPGLRVFQSGEVPALILTTPRGLQRIRERDWPRSVQIMAASDDDQLTARAILDAVSRAQPGRLILTEGGPQLIGYFFAEKCLDELFLTLAPQVAGRDDSVERPGLVAGKRFAPEQPLWGTLLSIKRAEGHLFLRYAFETSPA